MRDGGCEGDGGMPRRDLWAVAVPGEFCVIKNKLRANLKLRRVIPQQINKPMTVQIRLLQARSGIQQALSNPGECNLLRIGVFF